MHRFYTAIHGDYGAAHTLVGDDLALKKFIVKFVRDECYKALHSAVRAGDRDAAMREAEALKDFASKLGFTELHSSVSALEAAIEGKASSVALSLFCQVEEDYNSIVSETYRWIIGSGNIEDFEEESLSMLESLKLLQVDVQDGLNRFASNEKLYEKMLRKFPEAAESMEVMPFLESGDYETAVHNAHTLKGVTGNLSLTPLYGAYTDIVFELRKSNPKKAQELLADILPLQRKIIGCIRSSA